jgi:hypothetical protein
MAMWPEQTTATTVIREQFLTKVTLTQRCLGVEKTVLVELWQCHVLGGQHQPDHWKGLVR